MTCRRHGPAIDRYFEGQLGAEDEARMRARLAECTDCRAHYGRHLVVEAALSPDGEHAVERLWRGVQGATRSGPRRAKVEAARPIRRVKALALAGALGAAAILVVARRGAPPPTRLVSDPVARGGAAALAPPALHVFRSVSAHAAEPLADGAVIHSRDGLLFAYSNFDPALTHLMVFAIDAAYGVHWYYPAFLHARQDPEAVPILAAGSGIELGEEIRHELPPGALRVVALFLREPHGVLELEARVKELVADPRHPLAEPLPPLVPGAEVLSSMLRVDR
jgi:hypothetical protein